MSNNKKFLKEYLDAFSPVGKEFGGQKIWVDYVRPFVSEMRVDAYGTAYGLIKSFVGTSNTEQATKKVVLEAHCDEIAFIISQIESDGMIRVKTNGGSDNMIAPSMTVFVHTHDGKKVPGVFGWPAIHTREKRVDMGPEVHELWVDLGVDTAKKVAKLGVEVGNCITFDQPFFELGKYYVGRSLDNKIGGYIIAEVARELKEEGTLLPFDLYIVNAVQEEVGLFGARLIAQTIRPDIALVHDVTHNTNTPKMNKAKSGDVKGGAGPVIEYSSQNHKDLIKIVRDVAKEKEIPMQLSVGSQGNDTISFFLENIPTVIVASPLKYMHTTVEMVHKDDVLAAIRVFKETLKKLTTGTIVTINDQTHKYV
jgi:putative aminopeptidase FrvX